MPFYGCDNIQCWFQACIEEKYDAMDECEAGAYATYILAGIERLREECGEFLDTAMNNTGGTLADAIMNSVDWDDLMSDLREYYESEHNIVACDKCNTIRIGEVDECVVCQ